MIEASILDVCCGSRMFWFNKLDTRAVFADIRAEEHKLCDGRHLVIRPDLIADFRALPFADASFPVVVFDPPHLERVGQSSWMSKKYGRLNKKNVAYRFARRIQRGIPRVVATRCTHLQVERNSDPGKPDSGAHGCETGNRPAHRKER
jgi:hypothetical protein